VPVCARKNHTLKRSLTDPRPSAASNAYSDEILHRAGLSPVALTQKLAPEAIKRLYEAIRVVMTEWTEGYAPRRRRNYGKSHRVQAGDGRSRSLRKSATVCGTTGRSASVTRKTKQLLPALPEPTSGSRGSLVIAAAERRLAGTVEELKLRRPALGRRLAHRKRGTSRVLEGVK